MGMIDINTMVCQLVRTNSTLPIHLDMSFHRVSEIFKLMHNLGTKIYESGV